jgi:hypothetical protein
MPQKKPAAANDQFDTEPSEDLKRWPVAELYFATVRAIGTPIQEAAVKPLEQTLRQCNFDLVPIKLSKYIPDVEGDLGSHGVPRDPFGRYNTLMNAGDSYRERMKTGDAVLMKALSAIHEGVRVAARGADDHPTDRLGVAYLFRNLMHPDEVKRLRRLYDRQLFIISAFSPEDRRKKHLAKVLANNNEASRMQ